MSVFVNAAGETLSTTLTSAPTEDNYTLISAWVYRPSSESGGTANYIVHLDEGTGAIYNVLSANASAFQSRGRYDSGSVVNTGGSGPTADTWIHVAALLYPDTGSPRTGLYINGTYTSTLISAGTNTGRAIDELVIGAKFGDTASRWRGYIAEVAIFTPSDLTNSDAIVSELQTKLPSAVSSAEPIFYASLETDETVTTGGVTLTVNGTTTFDSGVHPTLSGTETGNTPPCVSQATRYQSSIAAASSHSFRRFG